MVTTSNYTNKGGDHSGGGANDDLPNFSDPEDFRDEISNDGKFSSIKKNKNKLC